jgi:hypothetical protein
MLTTLHTAYTDTRAVDLAWCLGGDPLPALAVLDLTVGPAAVQLRLLGASHQVVLDADDGPCSETVACLPGRRTPLPTRVAERIEGWEYEFAARIETLPPRLFATRAQDLLVLAEDNPRALAGVFPGDPSAFTALVAGGDGQRVEWRTWHAYPQEGALVCTRSALTARFPDRTQSGTAGIGDAAA